MAPGTTWSFDDRFCCTDKYLSWEAGITIDVTVHWVTVGAYLATAILCLSCVIQAKRIAQTQQTTSVRKLFSILAIGMFILAINKRYNLCSKMVGFAVDSAWEHGWYQARRIIQIPLIVAIVILCIAIFIRLILFSGSAWREYWLALFSLIFLVGLVVVRATSLHDVDVALNWQVMGIKLNWVLEYFGIAGVIISAIMVHRRPYVVQLMG